MLQNKLWLCLFLPLLPRLLHWVCLFYTTDLGVGFRRTPWSYFPVPCQMFWYVFKFTINWTSFCLWLLNHKILFAMWYWSSWSPTHHKWPWTNKMVVILSSSVFSILLILFKLSQHFTSVGWISFGYLFSLVQINLSRDLPEGILSQYKKGVITAVNKL